MEILDALVKAKLPVVSDLARGELTKLTIAKYAGEYLTNYANETKSEIVISMVN